MNFITEAFLGNLSFTSTHGYSDKDIQRYLSKISYDVDTMCLEWTAGKNSDGYGCTSKGSRLLRSNKVFYQLFNGEIPENLIVCHSCDNRACVNPAHLWLGTLTDNNRDRANKNRNRDQNGVKNNQNKLSKLQVMRIREMYAAGYYKKDIAESFGVSPALISKITLNKIWKEL